MTKNLPPEFDIRPDDDFENPTLVWGLTFAWMASAFVVYLALKAIGFSELISFIAGFFWMSFWNLVPNYFHQQRADRVFKEQNGEFSQREIVSRIADQIMILPQEKVRKIWDEYFEHSEITPIASFDEEDEKFYELTMRQEPHYHELQRWADDGGPVLPSHDPHTEPEKKPEEPTSSS